MIKANLRLAPEQGSEAARPASALGARHTFIPSPNPRTTSCVKCGRGEQDTVHAYINLAHRASVEAHLSMAQNAAREGDMEEATRQACVAIKLAQEEW